MYPTTHHRTHGLIDQAATDEGAQNPPTNPRLHPSNRDRIQTGRRMKIHFRPIVSISGWLECPIDDAAMKMDMFVK